MALICLIIQHKEKQNGSNIEHVLLQDVLHLNKPRRQHGMLKIGNSKEFRDDSTPKRRDRTIPSPIVPKPNTPFKSNQINANTPLKATTSMQMTPDMCRYDDTMASARDNAK